jgi:peptidoglycan hydrolase-like protein with peptidoglycan-binding domain
VIEPAWAAVAAIERRQSDRNRPDVCRLHWCLRREIMCVSQPGDCFTLINGAPGQRNTALQGIDVNFGPHTKGAVVAFQAWGGVVQDGVVGDQTWAVSLHAASATLETAVGLQFVIG